MSLWMYFLKIAGCGWNDFNFLGLIIGFLTWSVIKSLLHSNFYQKYILCSADRDYTSAKLCSRCSCTSCCGACDYIGLFDARWVGIFLQQIHLGHCCGGTVTVIVILYLFQTSHICLQNHAAENFESKLCVFAMILQFWDLWLSFTDAKQLLPCCLQLGNLS